MKVLDFSNQQFDTLNPNVDWENEILKFWKEWQNEDDFIIAQTSGSTGTPKNIKLPKSAMQMSARMTGEFFDLTKGKTALLCLPVSFIAGKMMWVRAIELGLKLYCVEPKSKIDLSDLASIDFVPMTPMQVEHSFEFLDKIKTLLIGGAPLSDVLRKRLLETNTQCFESYGMTETITHIALKEISETHFKTLKKVDIRKDERGCLAIQTPYFKEEIITNDLIEIQNENEFKWLGRFDNVINSGGVKLIPEQIESKLKSILKNEFVISSLPDETLGEKLILVIESENYEFEIPEGLLDKFEHPKEIHFIHPFPRTESGKIQRQKIIEQLSSL